MAKEVELSGKVQEGRAYELKEYILESRTRKAIEAMPWLTEADEGIITLALQYSKRIDNALRIADEAPDDSVAQMSATKALYLGPHLVNALKALGGTPGDRMDLEAKRLASIPAGEKEDDQIASFLADNRVKVAARARSRK